MLFYHNKYVREEKNYLNVFTGDTEVYDEENKNELTFHYDSTLEMFILKKYFEKFFKDKEVVREKVIEMSRNITMLLNKYSGSSLNIEDRRKQLQEKYDRNAKK